MPDDFLQPTPITACRYCERKFADDAARWQHMAEQHGIDASERLRLTQGAAEARAQFLERIMQEQARRMAGGQHS